VRILINVKGTPETHEGDEVHDYYKSVLAIARSVKTPVVSEFNGIHLVVSPLSAENLVQWHCAEARLKEKA